jgi:hypothetical protein
MKKQVKIKFYSPEAFMNVKEKAWAVCNSLYEMEEADFYQRLSIFKRFAIFWDGERSVGFLSFFENHIQLEGKKIVLLGIGHGGLLKDYRAKGLIMRASLPQMLRMQLKYPFKKLYMWGMVMSQLSYRLAVRNVEHYFIRSMTKTDSLEQKLIDYIGNSYYPDTYNPSRGIAAVRFHVKDPLAFPTAAELNHPLTQLFFRELPEAQYANNQKGLLYIYPVWSNYPFWIRKNILKTVK